MALAGFHKLVFLYLEPASTLLPAILAWAYPGPVWLYNQLVSGLNTPQLASFDEQNHTSFMLILQLVNCCFLLSLLSSFMFRTIHNNVASLETQQHLVTAMLIPLAIADITHIAVTFVTLPSHLRTNVGAWNIITHGNITFSVFLFLSRMSWLFGCRRMEAPKDNTKKMA